MRPVTVLSAALLAAATLAGCAHRYDDDDRRGYYREHAYTPPARYEGEERGRFSAVQVFTQPEFRGGTMSISPDGTSLDRPLSEGVNSLIVREGTWEICMSGKFEPSCRTFGPGRYERLGPRNEGSFQMTSIRRIG